MTTCPSVQPHLSDYADGTLLPDTRDAVGAALACRVYFDSNQTPDTNWRAFTLSRWQADQSLGGAQVQEILNNYGILDDNYPAQVQTPLGEIYDCVNIGMN